MENDKNFKEKKRDALLQIDKWCKDLLADTNVTYARAYVRCNNRNYRVSATKDGIVVLGDGKFSHFMYAKDGTDSLFNTKVGTEIIIQWPRLKEDLKKAKNKAADTYKQVLNFEV